MLITLQKLRMWDCCGCKLVERSVCSCVTALQGCWVQANLISVIFTFRHTTMVPVALSQDQIHSMSCKLWVSYDCRLLTAPAAASGRVASPLRCS